MRSALLRRARTIGRRWRGGLRLTTERWQLLLRGRGSVLALPAGLLALGCAAGLAVAAGANQSASRSSASNGAASAARASSRSAPPSVGSSAQGVSAGSSLGSRGAGPSIPKGAVALPKLFTATSRTYKSSRGLFTTLFYGHPVNYKGPRGEWLPIAASGAGGTATPPHIDASHTFGASQDCPLESGSPATSFCTSTTDYVGYDGTNTDNSLVQFNVKEVLPTGANVLNAQLGMYLYESSTTTGVSVSAYAVSRPWTTAASWNTYDGTNSWTAPGGDFSTTNAVANPSVTKPAGWAHWYPTQIVQEWVNEAGTNKVNNGFLLADTTQKQTTNLLSFYSSKASSENKPYLTVSWTPRGQEDPPFYSMQSFPLDVRTTMKVNLASGDLFVASDDLAVKGVGIPFLAEHNYDSLNTEGGSVNPWYSLPGAAVYADGSVAIGINRYDFATFIRKSNGEYITPPGVDAATLCELNGTTCKGNSIDGTKAKYALTFNRGGDSSLYRQGNKIDFGSNGGVWSIADRYGNALAFNYGSHGVSSISDTQGRTFTRNTTEIAGGSHVTSSWVESGGIGREVKYAYNANGHLETFTDAAGNKTKHAYDEEGELKEIKDPKGNVTSLTYNSSHQITKITRAEVGGLHPTWEYSYFAGTDTTHGHACKNPSEERITKKTVVKEPRGNESTFCATVEDEVLQSFDATGNETQAAFNSLGDTTSTTAAAPGNGELEKEGNIASFIYEKEGNAGAGRLNCAVTATPARQESCPTGPSEKLLASIFEYNDKKNEYLPTRVTDPQGNSVSLCYNDGTEAGCPEKTTGPAGSLQTVKDGLANQNELQFEHESKGDLTASTDARGNTTKYEYDEKGNVKKITPPAGSSEEEIAPTTISVDAASRPHVITDGEGHIETITYDSLDQVKEIAYTGTGTARTVKFEYDLDGNIIKREDPTGTTTYTVDALNRLTKESLPGALSNEYSYDLASNIEAFTDGGGTTRYKYNSLNLLESMTEPGERTTSLSYDSDHRLTKITYPSKAVESYKLEAFTGRPESITFEGLSGTTVPNLTYSYKKGVNDSELISALTESTGPKTEYTYDSLNRLELAVRTVSETSGSRYEFKFDGDGNRTQQHVNLTEPQKGGPKEEATYYHTNGTGLLECRQTVSGACSGNSSTELSHYKYDKAGEELAITPKADTSGSTFAFNAAKETKAITPAGGSEQALAYGGIGQADLVALGSSTLQNSLLGLTREATSGGTSYYARTPSGLLVDQRTPSGNFNPLYDAQGDVIALVSTSGKVERTFRYGPYGENVNSEGTQTIPDPFGFQGGYRVPGGNTGKGNVANGLDHFGQRYYDPTVGRWTQPDSLVGAPGFGFTNDDPINESDPSGHMGMAGMQTTAAQSTVRWCLHHPWAFYHNWGTYVRCQQAAKLANPGPDVFGEVLIKCAYSSAVGGLIGHALESAKLTVGGAIATCVAGVFAP
jgi:RHS repeat-associated protein